MIIMMIEIKKEDHLKREKIKKKFVNNTKDKDDR